MTDHTRLRELAQDATGGDWQVSETGAALGYKAVIAVWPDDDVHITDDGVPEADAEFIAAANPKTVLALLDELEDTRAAYQLTRHQLDAHRAGQGTYEGTTR